MKKYLALYIAPLASFDAARNTPPEEMKPWMDEWNKWMEAHKDVTVDPGTPVGKTKRVTADGVSDIRNTIGGYMIVQAESLEAAAAIFQGNSPHFKLKDASVEVMEFVSM